MAILDNYLKTVAPQDRRRKMTVPYVLVDRATSEVAGCYTLNNLTILPASLPEAGTKRLGRYAAIPAILIGRLATDQRYQGQHLGELLLIDALFRCLAISRQVGAWTVIVDAKTPAVRPFYERHGFTAMLDDPLRLYLPMKTIELQAAKRPAVSS